MFSLKLNPQQRRAVNYQDGPLLIVAGAGTGKTTVITERIIRLMQDLRVAPDAIVGLTFTEKAAEEMLARIDARMPLGYQEPWLSTFHAFCDRVLRQEALEIGLDPGYRILTQAQQWLLIRRHLYSFQLDYYRPLGNPTKFIAALVSFFARAKDEVIKPEALVEIAKKHQGKARDEVQSEDAGKLLELATADLYYQDLLVAENGLDFGDLILGTIKLFKNRPAVLKKYRDQFKYILVDEFQDTNVAQYELIKLLAPPEAKPNLTVVADDDQSIFRWRHASLYNTLEFKNDYPSAEVVSLTTNYRSQQKILDPAYQLIRFNNPDRLEIKLKIDKKLVSTRPEGPEPEVLWGETVEAEADLVIQKITSLVKSGYAFQDMAILARANNHLDPFTEALKRAQVPYSLVGNRGLFSQPEVKVLINVLQVIADPDDSAALYGVLKSPFFKFKTLELTQLIRKSHDQKETLFLTAQKFAVKGTVLNRLIKLIAGLHQKVHQGSGAQLLYEFILDSGLAARFIKEESIENQLRVKNLSLFYDRIRSFEREVENSHLWDFLDYLEQLLEAGEDPAQAEVEDVDTVKLLTVHSAKGLEFPVVFLVNLVRDRFPTRHRGETLKLPEELVKEGKEKPEAHLQEERRLFYVGVTRAKDWLFLTGAENYGGVEKKAPSKFLLEFLGRDPKKIAQTRQLSLFGEKLVRLSTGKRELPITHPPVRTWSYSRIETYLTCPLSYYYRYVLGFPGKPSFTMSFGQVIHHTLRAFHHRDLLGRDKGLDLLLATYENYFRTNSEGYLSSEQKQNQFAKGKEFLSRYFEVHQQVLGEPLELEKEFTLKIDDFVIKGRIDRIDRRPDGTIELVDYKVSGEEKLEARVDKDRQLTTYALGATKDLGLKIASLSLYSLPDNKRVVTQRTDEELEEFQKKLGETVAEIRQSDYPAKIGKHCEWCDYKYICPAYKASLKIG